MSVEFERNLDKYAEIIIKVGLNLQAGQRLLIGSAYKNGVDIELAPLIRLIVEKAYKSGAKLVDVMWDDEELHLIRFQHAPRSSFREIPRWRADIAKEFIEKEDALLTIMSDNPDALINQDQELVSQTSQARSKAIAPTIELITKGVSNWTIIAAPTTGWATKLFPHLSPEERKSKFWDIIFKICRINRKNPTSAWREHFNQLKLKCEYLNNKQYNALELNAPGTSLIIGLPEGHKWEGGDWTSQNGIVFTPNLPTEEIFTTPHKDKTEGTVTATKPLYYGGNLFENFKLTFSEGKVIEITAKNGKEIIQKYLKMDEGASRLGEIALVPHSSPISQSGMLFYNILFDENASNHIALGRGIKTGIKNGEKMSDDEFESVGGNTSLIHIDFMIGSGEMDVDGILDDGMPEPIMRKGEWAFKT